jgi:PKD repeat protein
VATTPGINQTFPKLRLTSGSSINASAAVSSLGINQTFPNLQLTSGSGINASAAVSSPGINQTFPKLRITTDNTIHFGIVISTYASNLYFSILPTSSIDDSRNLSLGVGVDFVGYPRIGRKPLGVDFNHLCRGPITEFYWLFGDGNRSYHSDPANLYTRVGIYDVYLRVRIGNRYYDLKKTRYIVVLAGDLIVSTTDTSLRCAVTKDQGIGMYRLPVTGMPMPEARVGVLSIIDDDGVNRGLVLDASTGKWFDVTTREVNGENTSWLGIASVNLDRTIRFGEDRSGKENEKLRFGEGHIGIRPLKETNRTEDGYDDNGFPDGMEATLSAYIEGEPTTPKAVIQSIPFDGGLLIRGDLRTDRKVEATRIQWEIVTNRGAHSITDKQMQYILSRKSASPALRVMPEGVYQKELANIITWPGWINRVLRDRKTGSIISVTATLCSGISGRPGSGIQISSPISLGSHSPGSLFFWSSSPVVVEIDGSVITLLTDDNITAGGTTWTFYYADSITEEGIVTITPSGSTDLFDIRLFGGILSSDARLYYFSDVDGNNGRVVLPQ